MRKFVTKRKMQRIESDPNVNIIVDNFHGVNWRQKLVRPIFVVYRDPKDFPGKFVVRIFDGKKPLRLATVKNSLEAARAAIQQGPPFEFGNMGRFPEDDPVIVESWI